jgi:transposase-like protein
MTDARLFRGLRFPAEVILWVVRWYLQFPISYRDLARMLADRGVEVDHVSLYRWVQASPRNSRSACGGTCALAAGRGGSVRSRTTAPGR